VIEVIVSEIRVFLLMLSRFIVIKDQGIQFYFDRSIGAVFWSGNEVIDIEIRQPGCCSLQFSRIHPIPSDSKHSCTKHLQEQIYQNSCG